MARLKGELGPTAAAYPTAARSSSAGGGADLALPAQSGVGATTRQRRPQADAAGSHEREPLLCADSEDGSFGSFSCTEGGRSEGFVSQGDDGSDSTGDEELPPAMRDLDFRHEPESIRAAITAGVAGALKHGADAITSVGRQRNDGARHRNGVGGQRGGVARQCSDGLSPRSPGELMRI